MVSRVRSLLRELPLIGGLSDTRWSDHREAAKEFFVVIAISTSPIYLGAIVAFALDQAANKSYLASLIASVKSGELFLYCTATLAPTYYLVLREVKGRGKFPNKLSLIVVTTIIMMLCFAFFGVEKPEVRRDLGFIFPLSYGLMFGSWFIYYCVKVYDIKRVSDYSSVRRAEEEEFSKHLSQHREAP